MRRKLLTVLSLSILAQVALAQRAEVAKGQRGVKIPYVVAEPEGYDAAKTYPVLLALPSQITQKDDLLGLFAGATKEALRQGFVVVAPISRSVTSLAPLLRHLRLSYRIESQRFFVAGNTRALWLLESRLSDISCVLVTAPTDADRVMSPYRDYASSNLPVRYCKNFAKDLHAARMDSAPKEVIEQAIAKVIDDFNDAAAKADGERYFGHFAPKGVFLGTDGTERWTAKEFRAWGMKYFDRPSAWIFVPQSRNIDIAGDFAWFDEALHSDTYGACRGTGAVQKIDGVWKIAQYNLSVPIPNPLMAEVVARIASAKKKALGAGTTTVILVRHAEKEKVGKDPGLTAAGKARALRLAKHLTRVDLTAGYATTYLRTQATIAQSCKDDGIVLQALDPRADVAAKILKDNRGGTILVGGHSNTVPAILKGLGVKTEVTINDAQYDNLFVVTIDPFGAVSYLNFEF